MSGDMFSQGEGYKKVEFERINLQDCLESSCCYIGKCHIDKTINIPSDICNVCIYQSRMDIPRMIMEKMAEKRIKK